MIVGPRPMGDQINIHSESIEYYSNCTEYAEGLHTKSDELYRYAALFVAKHVGRDMALLEVGCGTGRLAEIIADRTGCAITATDVSPLFVQRAREKANPHVQVTYEVADAMALPYEDASFDGVYTYQAVEHFPDAMRGLREIVRVTRPGGSIVIITPNLLSPVHPAKRLVKCALRLDGQSLSAVEDGERVVRVCTRQMVMQTLDTLRHLLSDGVLFFTAREPDYSRPGHGDSDATWVCNAMDMRQFLSGQRCEFVELRGARTWWLGPFAGSVHLAMRR